jgi:hypothetical protein
VYKTGFVEEMKKQHGSFAGYETLDMWKNVVMDKKNHLLVAVLSEDSKYWHTDKEGNCVKETIHKGVVGFILCSTVGNHYGYQGCSIPSAPSCYTHALYLKPEVRSWKLGRALFATMDVMAKIRKSQFFYLLASNNIETAAGLYKRYQYKCIHMVKGISQFNHEYRYVAMQILQSLNRRDSYDYRSAGEFPRTFEKTLLNDGDDIYYKYVDNYTVNFFSDLYRDIKHLMHSQKQQRQLSTETMAAASKPSGSVRPGACMTINALSHALLTSLCIGGEAALLRNPVDQIDDKAKAYY